MEKRYNKKMIRKQILRSYVNKIPRKSCLNKKKQNLPRRNQRLILPNTQFFITLEVYH